MVWRVEFPWGFRLVASGRPLTVGRDTPGLESELASYPNVSRKHALFTGAEHGVIVTDLASTNGSYINDIQIAPRESAVAHDGDVVRLAADLYSTVRRVPADEITA